MLKLATRLAINLLKRAELSTDDRAALVTAILDKNQALPIRDVLLFDEQRNVFIDGKQLTGEQTIMLRSSAESLKDSFARKVVHDQTTFEIVKLGLHQGLNPEMILFAKAALWCHQTEDRIIASLQQ